MDAGALGSQLVLGLSRGMLYFIVAAGLTLVFGVLRIINFAHGSFYMLGAFLSFSVAEMMGKQNPAGFWLALVVAPVVVAAFSIIIERGLLRFVYGQEHLIQMLLTYSLVLILGDLVKMVWGTEFKSVSVPGIFIGNLSLVGIIIPVYYVFMLVVGPVVALGLWLFLTRTVTGKICRATATDRQMVDVLGINSTRVFGTVFALGGWLAGLGGALMAPMVNIGMGMDASMVVYAFLVVVVGGLGNIWGTLISALILGVAEALGVLFLPNLAIVVPFAVIGILLIMRPSGLLKSVW